MNAFFSNNSTSLSNSNPLYNFTNTTAPRIHPIKTTTNFTNYSTTTSTKRIRTATGPNWMEQQNVAEHMQPNKVIADNFLKKENAQEATDAHSTMTLQTPKEMAEQGQSQRAKAKAKEKEKAKETHDNKEVGAHQNKTLKNPKKKDEVKVLIKAKVTQDHAAFSYKENAKMAKTANFGIPRSAECEEWGNV